MALERFQQFVHESTLADPPEVGGNGQDRCIRRINIKVEESEDELLLVDVRVDILLRVSGLPRKLLYIWIVLDELFKVGDVDLSR